MENRGMTREEAEEKMDDLYMDLLKFMESQGWKLGWIGDGFINGTMKIYGFILRYRDGYISFETNLEHNDPFILTGDDANLSEFIKEYNKMKIPRLR